MKKTTYFLITLFLLTSSVISQTIDTVWSTHVYGVDDGLKQIAVDNENSILVISTGANDMPYVYKFSENGDSLWRTTIAFANLDDRDIDIANVAVGKDSNYLVLSNISIAGEGEQYDDQSLVSILSQDGEILHSSIYGNGSYYYLKYIAPSYDGGYHLAGGSFKGDSGIYRLQLVKVNERGEFLAERYYDFVDDCSLCEGMDIIETSDSGLVLSGSKFVMKLDKDYDQEWRHDDGFLLDYSVRWIRETNNKQYFVGLTEYFAYNLKYLAKLDEYGDTLWVKPLENEAWKASKINDGIVLDDGSIMLSGAVDINGYGAYRNALILVDENGEILTYHINYGNDVYYWLYMDQLQNGDFVGSTGYFGKGLVMRYTITPVGIEAVDNQPKDFALYQNYPNPFNPTTTIKYSIPAQQASLRVPTQSGRGNLSNDAQQIASSQAPRNDVSNVTLKVYDILGREVATLVSQKQAPGNYSVKFDASKLTSGIYFYKLQSGSFSQTRKMILMK